MKRTCEVCGGIIPINKRSDAKVCSDYCRTKKYAQTEKGKKKSVEKTRRYQVTEKGTKTKRKADAKYYRRHKEKWFTPEMLQRAKLCTEARILMQKAGKPYMCVGCEVGYVSLDVHHIDKDWKNNDLSNLEYRCKSCHNRIHGKIKKTVPIEDSRRKSSYTESEIIMHLKQAAKQIGNIPFSQTSYTNLGKGRPTVKTIVKYKDWKDWMNLLK